MTELKMFEWVKEFRKKYFSLGQAEYSVAWFKHGPFTNHLITRWTKDV